MSNYFISETKTRSNGLKITIDDNILTEGFTTCASRMLENYNSLFAATAVEKLLASGAQIAGKTNISEFGLGLLSEDSYFGPVFSPSFKDALSTGGAAAIAEGLCDAAVAVDTNGAPRRAALAEGIYCYKPSYGLISRYGIVAAVSSCEGIAVSARELDTAAPLAGIMMGADPKDGTLTEKKLSFGGYCVKGKKAALINEYGEDDILAGAVGQLIKNGCVVKKISMHEVKAAHIAYYTMLCAESCNNLSRFDGIKYGYRSPRARTLEEIYVMSRSEGFGLNIKKIIMLGSELLAKDNYEKYYNKALKIRRVLRNRFDDVFNEYDIVLLPAASKRCFTINDIKNNPDITLDESYYTALANLLGLPSIVTPSGVQILANNMNDECAVNIARCLK